MSLWLFLSEAILISLSGVMAPGPLSATTVGKGSESPHAGAWIAVGHGVVEFPLMIAIFFGAGQLFDLPNVKAGIGLVGGLFLLYMGVGMLRSFRDPELRAVQDARSPIAAGALLSLGNPYFLVWWATVGATLILRSVTYGLFGFSLFAIGHWLCDLFWCYFLSVLSFKGGQFFGRRFQQAIFLVCGILLLFFSGRFVMDGIRLFLDFA